jgi:hypothetical protein
MRWYRSSSSRYSASVDPRDKCLVFGKFILEISHHLPSGGWYGLSGALVLPILMNFGYALWRHCRRRSFPWLGWAASESGLCRKPPQAPVEKTRRLVSWELGGHLHSRWDTSVEKLDDGDERIAILHFPEDLLVVDDHISNFVDCLVGLAHIIWINQISSTKLTHRKEGR